MYALINTMSAVDVYVGRVLSLHRSIGAAEIADTKFQRAVKRANGKNSYLPTIVRKINRKSSKGDMIERADVVNPR